MKIRLCPLPYEEVLEDIIKTVWTEQVINIYDYMNIYILFQELTISSPLDMSGPTLMTIPYSAARYTLLCLSLACSSHDDPVLLLQMGHGLAPSQCLEASAVLCA